MMMMMMMMMPVVVGVKETVLMHPVHLARGVHIKAFPGAIPVLCAPRAAHAAARD
jgi:hypothetical protein